METTEQEQAKQIDRASKQAGELSAAGMPLPKNWLAAISFIWAGQAASMITSYANITRQT